MRTKDIEVGKEYAYQRSKLDKAARALVVEVGLQREMFDGWRNRKAHNKDGVRIQYRGYWSGQDEIRVVPAVHIIRAWSEQVEIEAAAAKAKLEKREADDARRERSEHVCAALIPFGVNVGESFVDRLCLTLEQWERILPALQAGRPTPMAFEFRDGKHVRIR